MLTSPFFILLLLLSAGCSGDDAKDAFSRGEKLRNDGRYLEALGEYRYVVLHYADSKLAPEALYRTGEINYLYLDEFDLAVDAFRSLMGNYPWSNRGNKAQSHLADIYMYKLNDYRQAVVEYQKAISRYGRDEESEKFQYEITNAYFNLSSFAQQRVELNLLLDRFPDTSLRPAVRSDIANSYYVEGKLDEAVLEYRKIVEDYPDTPISLEATFQLAACLEEKEDLKGALEILEDIERVYSNPKIVRFRIDRIKKRLKKKRR